MKIVYRVCWIFIRFYLVVFCKLKIRGIENVPKTGGVIIASNHIGAGDPFFVGTCINRELYFLAKKELFVNPLIRFIIRTLNAIPVDRSILDQKALEASESALRNGYGLIMFPEGTRSRNDELKRGKPGVGLLARRAEVPVVPVYIENTRGFHKLILSSKRMEVTFGEPVAADWIAGLSPDKIGYRAISEEIMRRIAVLKGSE